MQSYVLTIRPTIVHYALVAMYLLPNMLSYLNHANEFNQYISQFLLLWYESVNRAVSEGNNDL